MQIIETKAKATRAGKGTASAASGLPGSASEASKAPSRARDARTPARRDTRTPTHAEGGTKPSAPLRVAANGRPAGDPSEKIKVLLAPSEVSKVLPRTPAHNALTRARTRGGSSIVHQEPRRRSTDSADGLYQAAASLTKAEQRELLDRLALLTKTTNNKREFSRELDAWVACVHQELGDQLAFDGGEGYGVLMVRKELSTEAYWRPVEAFVERSKLDQGTTSAERRAVYMMLAGLLVAYARRSARRHGIDLSLKLVARCSGQIASIFEQSFPGYVEAGLAPVVAMQMQALATGEK